MIEARLPGTRNLHNNHLRQDIINRSGKSHAYPNWCARTVQVKDEKVMGKPYISRREVEHIAWLAHIELTEEEKELFTKQLNEILEYFRKIDEAETEGVPPTYHVLDLVNVYREDEVEESLPKGDALKNAPKKERGFFKAPKII